jgi:hypothetical protein
VDPHRGYLQRLLGRDVLLAGTVAVSVVNGLDFSPIFDSIAYYLYSFAKNTPLFHADVFYYLTSFAISLMTLLLAGIPAALYERMRGLPQSTPASLAIWLAAAVLLSLPTLLSVIGED